MKKIKTAKKIFFLIFLFGFFCLAILTASAVDQPIKLKLQVAIPGLGDSIDINGSAIAVYIMSLYKFFVGALAIVAVVMIMIAGYRWLLSSGSSERVSKSKDMIINAVVGLILGLTSYLLLYTLNPNLVKFESLTIVPINPESIFPGNAGCCSLVDNQSLFLINSYAHDYYMAVLVDSEQECNNYQGQTLTDQTYQSYNFFRLLNPLVTYYFKVDSATYYQNNPPSWFYYLGEGSNDFTINTCEMHSNNQFNQLTSPYPVCAGGNPTKYLNDACQYNGSCNTIDYPYCVLQVGQVGWGLCSNGCPGNQCDDDADCLSNKCQYFVCSYP